MIKKRIEFKDYNGNLLVEDFHFNLSTAEIVELEMSEKDGLSEALQKLVSEQDGEKIIAMFKTLILKAYGQKSEDGRRFIKSPTLREEFSQTEAYSQLFMELATSAEAATEFVTGVVPAEGLAPDALGLVAQPTKPVVPPAQPSREALLAQLANLPE